MATDLYGAGTTVDWPGGLEYIFEYNDLVLNDLTSGPDRYRISKIDGLFDLDVRDSRDINTSRHGETSYDSFYGGRPITIYGTIYAGNMAKLRNMIGDLIGAFSDLQDHQLKMYKYANYIINTPNATLTCKKFSPIIIEEENTSIYPRRNFTITLRASDPFIYGNTLKTYTITPTTISIPGKAYDKAYNFEYDSYPITADQQAFINSGSFRALPTITFSGGLTNPAITDSTGNLIMSINADIPATNYYIYNQNLKTLVDKNGASRISALSIASSQLEIQPGTSTYQICVEGYDGSGNIKFDYYDTWI